MKRLLIVALLLLISSSLAAQEAPSIYDLATGSDDLSTLVAAVDAAGLAETLQSDGPFTVLAPTNAAFANLLATLNISAEDLLANELLGSILLYHVLPGEILASDFVAAAGQTRPTALDDNFIAVSVADDGTVVLNDVVEVIATDLDASNGVVHLINDVLLPQAALDAFGLGPAINTNLQVLHMAPDAPNVDIYMDGAVAIADLAYGTSSGYVTLPAGDYEVAVAPAGTSLEQAVLGPLPLTLNAGSFLSVAVIGSVADGTLSATLFTQSFPILPETEAPITVLHALEGAPAVDVVADGVVRASSVAFPGSDGTNDGAGNLSVLLPFDTLTVNASGTDTVLLDLSDAALDSGTFYLVAVSGTLDAPQAFTFATSAAEFEMLQAALNTELVDETPAPQTIADVVVNSAQATEAAFTILLQAVQNADPALLEALQGADPITVFAPTDEAFTNLLASTGLTAEELLASPLLSDILRYHVVPGALLASDVVALDGDFAPTALADNFIAVNVVDGAVVLNDVVNVVQTDISASNGVIHVVDEVLLPNAALQALGLTGNSQLQVLHAAPDAPPVDVYLNGEVAISNLAYGTTSGYRRLPAGDYEVAVAPAGTSLEQAVLGPQPLTLTDGGLLSLAAVGSLSNGTLRATLFTQSFPLLPATEVPLTVLHAIEGAPAVDLVLDGTPVAEGLAYPGTQDNNDGVINTSVQTPFTSLTVNVSSSDAVVLDLSATVFEAGLYYVVIAGGTADAPQPFLLAYDANELGLFDN